MEKENKKYLYIYICDGCCINETRIVQTKCNTRVYPKKGKEKKHDKIRFNNT